MPWPDMTYGAYVERGGSADEAGFRRLLPYALRAVRREVWPLEPQAEHRDAVLDAIAAAIDVDVAWGGTHGMSTDGGMSLGSFSVTGSTGSGGFAAERRAAILEALSGTGLACGVVM